MESWMTYLMYGAVGAIVLAILLIVAYRKKLQYDEEADRNILAEVWLPTGRPIPRVVKPGADGWVRLGKLGDYKLAEPRKLCKCGHDEKDHVKHNPQGGITCTTCACTKFEVDKVLPAIRRWAKYPSTPFLGLKALQTKIRTEAWWLNNPEPITPDENRTRVTAIDAQVHTREMEGESAAIQIQQLEAQQKQLIEAIGNQPNKMFVYVMLVAVILVSVINLVQAFASKGG